MTLEMGADRLAFSNLVLDHPEHAHASIIHSPIFRFNLKRAKALAAKLGLDCVYFMQKPFPWREERPPPIDPGVRYGCPAAWRGVIVERDGNIKPCCYIDVSYGNTAETSLPDAYNGEAALALRKSFITRDYNEGCKGCGQFVQVTDAATKDLIDRADAAARAGEFSDGVRERLLHMIGHYREMAADAAKK
jgi:MoaA/NifB/PqqE/SkfB family radical SAM enzyme